jgi:hypothetical protein
MLFSPSQSATLAWLDSSELALLLFAAVLAIGLIGQQFTQSRGKGRLMHACVVIGISGELISDGSISLFSRHLQAISDREIAILNNKTESFRLKADELEARFAEITNNTSTIDPKDRPIFSVKAYLFWSIESRFSSKPPDLSGAVGFIWITPYPDLNIHLHKIELTQSGPWLGYTSVFSGAATQDSPKPPARPGSSALQAMQQMERIDISIGNIPVTNQVVYVSSLQIIFNGRVEREFHPIRSKIDSGSWTMNFFPTTNDIARVGSW